MIQNAAEFVRACKPKPWLVLGKGPTAGLLRLVDVSEYHVLTLNHACKITHPTLAHFVDMEAFRDCGDLLAEKLIPTCLPWYPHENNKAGSVCLLRHCGLFGEPGKSQALAWLAGKEFLYSYNATTAGPRNGPPHPKLPVVRLKYFSAVGAFNLLGAGGVREVHTLGVDGGTEYAPAFDPKTRLANGRPDFDVQFGELMQAVRRWKITWTKLASK